MRRLARPAAAGGILRRPAAAAKAVVAQPARRVRRRPAGEEAAPEAEEGAGAAISAEEAAQKYRRGETVEGVRLAPGVIEKGDLVVATQGVYCQQKASFAIKVEKEELEGGERELSGISSQGLSVRPFCGTEPPASHVGYRCIFAEPIALKCARTQIWFIPAHCASSFPRLPGLGKAI